VAARVVLGGLPALSEKQPRKPTQLSLPHVILN
jgi:hypothetical protein